MKFQVNILITFTKAFALLVLLLGSIFSILYNSSEVILFTLSLSAGLAGLKNWSDGLTERRKIERRYERDEYDEHQKINDERG